MGIPHNLNAYAEGVPTAARPVYWDIEKTVEDNLFTIESWRNVYSELVPKGARIDEAAVMVPSPWHASRLGSDLVKAGWECFNLASDIAYTNPFGTRYFVEYMFYRHPARGYRLEVMHMGQGKEDGRSGFSPLHQALWYPNDGKQDTAKYPIPHLSFKAPGNPMDRQPRAAYSRAVAHLQAKGCLQAQTCQSTYGVFGYYLPHDAQRVLYIKPRVNLRDAECGQPAPCGHNPDGGNHPVAA